MSPTSRTSDGEEGASTDGTCLLGCGLISAGPPEHSRSGVINHFLTEHREIRVVIERVHFTMATAPMRCDLCNVAAELPYWTRSVSGRYLGDDDGQWLICQTCESALKDNDITAVWQRWKTIALLQSPLVVSKETPSFWKETEQKLRLLASDLATSSTELNTIESP